MGIMGRPRIEFTNKEWKQMERMCGIQGNKEEIASVMQCSEDTLEKRIFEKHSVTFTVWHGWHSGTGRMSLKRNQWKLSEKNAAMAIWLGKQYLGQKDNQDFNISGSNITLNYKIDDE